MISAVLCQLALLAFHQVTTLVDLYPFNGARNYSAAERRTEVAVNAVLMSLAPVGFVFQIRALMLYGAVYYFVLFAVELVIWWVPYFVVPSGRSRKAYNLALSLSTSNFDRGDPLDHWLTVHERLHAGTLTLLPRRVGRIVPNLEHTLLHAWTLVTALVTLQAVNA